MARPGLKTAAALLLLAAVACGLMGCGSAYAGSVDLPDEPVPLAVLPRANGQWRTMTLHIPSNSMQDVVKKTEQVYVLEYESVYCAAIKELAARMQATAQSEGSGVPSLSVLSVGVCGESATVNLSGNRAALSERQLFTVLYGIVNTLTEFDGIRYVGVLWQDAAFLLDGAPVGMLTRFDSDVGAALGDYTQNASKLRVQLYFRSPNLPYLMTEVREVRTGSGWGTNQADLFDQLLAMIIDELSSGPRDTVNQARLLRGARLDAYRYYLNAEGKYELALYISGTDASISQGGGDSELAAASIAMSVIDLIPDCAGVAVIFGKHSGLPAAPAAASLDELPMEKALYRPEIELMLGDILPLYYPREGGGKLMLVRNVVESYRGAQADGLLPDFFTRPAPDGFPVTRILPEGIGQEDLSLSYMGETAYVEVSERLYQAIRRMDAQAERDSIYAIVNTLCAGRGVSAVQFVMDGAPCPDAPGRINLSEPLLFNPGIT